MWSLLTGVPRGLSSDQLYQPHPVLRVWVGWSCFHLVPEMPSCWAGDLQQVIVVRAAVTRGLHVGDQ